MLFKAEGREIESPDASDDKVDSMSAHRNVDFDNGLAPCSIERKRDFAYNRAIGCVETNFDRSVKRPPSFAAQDMFLPRKGKVLVAHRRPVAKVGDIGTGRACATGIDFLRDNRMVGCDLKIAPIVDSAVRADQMAADACGINASTRQRLPIEPAACDLDLRD